MFAATTFRKLRVRSVTSNPWHLASQLSRADLQPSLPAASILCVRRLQTPLPKGAALSTSARAWEDSVKHKLETLARSAARPLESAVPANAEAVLFADEAEVLACLTKDWLSGELTNAWWWRSLYPNFEGLPLRAWQVAPEAMPAALEHLTKRNLALPFLRRLEPREMQTLWQMLVRHFGLVKLVKMEEILEDATLLDKPKPETPWQSWINVNHLSLEATLFLNIGLMLRHQPTLVRSSVFAQRLQQWLHQKPVTPHSQSFTPSQRSLTFVDATNYTPNYNTPNYNTPNYNKANYIDTNTINEKELSLKARAKELSDLLTFQEESKSKATSELHHEDTFLTSLESTQNSSLEISEESQPRVSEDIPLLPNESVLNLPLIETQYGGVFFLLNVALALELYGDFSRPLEPGLELSPWDFLVLVGGRLVRESFQADPLWLLLAKLAVRSQDEPPGKDFEAPSTWRLPTSWLGAFPESTTYTWNVHQKRLQVCHSEGFLLVDVPRRGKLSQQLTKELKPYPSQFTVRQDRNIVNEATPLERWLDWLEAYLRARLAQAVGTEDVGALLCQHSAKVFLSGSNLEVVFSLETHPLELRLAGLDRDPGWIPAAGYSLRFRFE